MFAQTKFARHLSSVSRVMSEAVVLEGKPDRFKGITIKSTDNETLRGPEFGDKLKKSLQHWVENSVRTVWFNVDLRYV